MITTVLRIDCQGLDAKGSMPGFLTLPWDGPLLLKGTDYWPYKDSPIDIIYTKVVGHMVEVDKIFIEIKISKDGIAYLGEDGVWDQFLALMIEKGWRPEKP